MSVHQLLVLSILKLHIYCTFAFFVKAAKLNCHVLSGSYATCTCELSAKSDYIHVNFMNLSKAAWIDGWQNGHE